MQKLNNKKVVFIDGGLSTELDEVGFVRNSRNLWTGDSVISAPEKLKQAHVNFLMSGADVIATASYQLNIDLIQKDLKCSVDEARELIKKSVKIAKEALQESKCENRLIAGSIGPYGASLCDGSEFDGHYVDNLTNEFLVEWHRPRLECLIEGGCDFIAFETIPSIKEAAALVKLLSEYPSIKAWLSFSCQDTEHLCIGDKFSDAYAKFKDNEQLLAIGVNCTNPRYVSELLKSVRDKSTPFIVYSNDGKIWDSKTAKFISLVENPIDIVYELIPEWINLGAKFIGGCCNIGSKELKKIYEIIESHLQNLKE